MSMSPMNVMRLYRARLRARVVLIQECFAIVGIAVGVALLFASQISSASLNGSVAQLTSGVVGQSRLQLSARDPLGFSETLARRVTDLPGVQAIVPVLEQRARVIGPRGSSSIDLVGTEVHDQRLGGPLVSHLSVTQLGKLQVFALPAPIARAIGASTLQPAKIQVGARVLPALVISGQLVGETGELVSSQIAIAPLDYAQALTGMHGRLSRIFVQPRAGAYHTVRAELQRLAGEHLNVAPANFDSALFSQAAGPINQSTATFSAISALVGFLFALNAILLTVHLRRDLIDDLHLDGATRRMTVEVLLFDALVLGVLACLLGLALGDLLSIAVFHANPGYLSFAFPIGAQRIVRWQSVALAVAGGLAAATIGVLFPLGGLLPRPRWPGRSRRRAGRSPLGPLAGVACLLATTVILLAAPQSAVVGMVTLIVGLTLLLGAFLDLIVTAFDRLQRRIQGASTRLAIIELRTPGSRARSLAIAATGAIAVFGSVTIQGASGNLQHGLDSSARELDSGSEIWVSTAGSFNTFATTPFRDRYSTVLSRLEGVKSVGIYRGGFLDWGDRRVWVLAPPSSAPHPVPQTQLLNGHLAQATARLRSGDWAVISQAIASELHLHIGQRFKLPAPNPIALRVAGMATNLGWPPGTIIMNSSDYARAWGSADPSAYNVTLDPGASTTRVVGEIQRALGPASGLSVQSASERERHHYAQARAGLVQLSEIRALVLIAALLAMSGAMGAMIWQRRPQLAYLKLDGFDQGVLWRALLWESALLLGAGCLVGALFGIYGQLLLSHALASVTGFPIVTSLGIQIAVWSFVLVTCVAVLIVALPGYLASAVRPAVSPSP